MANVKNLIPQNKRSKKERSRIAKMGAEASNKAQRERKELKESLLMLLDSGNGQDNLCTALFEKALTGDVKAFEVIRDTIGQKPVEKQVLTFGDMAEEDINEVEKALFGDNQE